jgi:hypothetical protein
MINIDKCKNIAKALAVQSKGLLGEKKCDEFYDAFSKIVTEYYNKYMFYSTAVELQKLKSFNEWASAIITDKDLLTPIIVDKMVNEKDLYSLSLYQNFYAGTDLIPDIESEYKSEYYKNGGGENALALITGCHWIEQTESSELVE